MMLSFLWIDREQTLTQVPSAHCRPTLMLQLLCLCQEVTFHIDAFTEPAMLCLTFNSLLLIKVSTTGFISAGFLLHLLKMGWT